jgi:polysaccharide deacetylase 2 family uncharacterized protein YibQ
MNQDAQRMRQWAWSAGPDALVQSPLRPADGQAPAMSGAAGRSGDKRETMDAKIAERAMVAHRGMNPFLGADYARDMDRFRFPTQS